MMKQGLWPDRRCRPAAPASLALAMALTVLAPAAAIAGTTAAAPPAKPAHPAAAAGASVKLVDGTLEVRFEGLRSDKGMLRACMTGNPHYFPNCERDPAAFKGSVAAAPNARLDFSNVPPGDYALMVLHDENDNDRVDKWLGIPREGVGFSRNPVLHFGPPKWAAARIHVPSGLSETDVKLRYFL